MKTLTPELLTLQKQATSEPAISLVCRAFGHPEKAGGAGGGAADALYPGLFNWTCLYSTDTIPPTYHGVTIPGDGSLVRVRTKNDVPAGIVYQRIANPSPSSNFGAPWTLLDNSINNYPCCITSLGSEVLIFSRDYNNVNLSQCWRSTNYGQSFAEPVTIINSGGCARAIAACHKNNGDCAVVGANSSSALWIARRISGIWYYAIRANPPDVYGLAIYHDGDWNIIALVNVSGTFKLARIVFGDGYRVPNGIWSGIDYLNLGSAEVDAWSLQQQYYDKPPWERMPLPVRRPRPPRRIGIGAGPHRVQGGKPVKYPWEWSAYAWYVGPAYYSDPKALAVRAIYAARAIDNLDLDAPFICKPPGEPPVLSAYKLGDKWFWRLKPGTDFYDSKWYKADKHVGSCIYGLALASDGTWLWGTRANEVWRSPLPMKCWNVPNPGSGASSGSQSIPQADVIDVEEIIRPMSTSRLELTLDNSKGSYSSLPSTHINKGARVEFSYGYGGECAPANHYFIEDWTYDRAPNQATVTIHCIDAWGLLEKYAVPGYHEFNMAGDTHSAYALIQRVIQCIGGTLSYYSRSSDITSLYPRFEVRPGETGAGLLRRLLALVPDVIIFCGLQAFIVYPQHTDTPVYSYTFPEGT